ncbi:hypothetical protein [Roseateles amylovorans]|uniref:Uncharacterized protein n=1 Tax=Roseateles amylovorans TaxID=2978473 RepID=A0ABY6B2E6_9BURK|nr:hypothetical protein [Roseateles amylovorans]UXH79393.1 hypothetical protein N4261_05550 [Roseateles amylovorans]
MAAIHAAAISRTWVDLDGVDRPFPSILRAFHDMPVSLLKWRVSLKTKYQSNTRSGVLVCPVPARIYPEAQGFAPPST